MKELKPILVFIIAIMSFIVIAPIGIFYNFCKSIYKANIFSFIKYWLNMFYQLWISIKCLFWYISIVIDLLGNATSGELIEDCITTEEDTWFGKGGKTISAAVGKQEVKGKINEYGWKLTHNLNKVFREKNHAVDAYIKEVQYPINK